MDIQILGTPGVREGGVQVVPVCALVQELWADRPPRSARTTLQTYVLQPRELITAALAHSRRGVRTVREPLGIRRQGRGVLSRHVSIVFGADFGPVLGDRR